MSLAGKTILVTGGTGSFGRKFAEIALKEADPRALRILSRDELKQLQMQEEFDDERLRFFIGDVRDRDRLYRAMSGVDVVVHAAALKQVPTAEYNPLEAVKTNVNGTANVIDAAIDAHVPKVLMIGTDKAVRPVNLYGATKLVAEKLFIQGNAYGVLKVRFSTVRYGNVVGSRGSVIPLFLKQRKNGALTITDERMTRFWITMEQGVRFVIDSIERMRGGEIFVPKIPSMRIVDVARTLVPGARLETIGTRPGEKLHEELITTEEAPRTRAFDDYYVIEPEHPFWVSEPQNGGDPVGRDFEYRSDRNSSWLTAEELTRYVAGLMPETGA